MEIKGFVPNHNQREAILHTEGPLFLTAGPGSGKTRVILWRTVNLIVFHEVDPKDIFLATFTEKAAHQLKEGLRGLLGSVTNVTGQPYDISGMSIGTVHSICQEILIDSQRRFADGGIRRRAPSPLDELSQYFTSLPAVILD
ncbi:MAG: UvrD-helicase domain-containing protein [Bacteroidetes bacterium]|nr:UvrD-helicase domain-containing protein [Bacteroidota bacterium]